MGDRFVKSDENIMILHIDATNLYGLPMSQILPIDEIEMWHGHPDFYMKNLEEILNTPDDSDIGYFSEVDSRNAVIIKDKTKNFPFGPEKKMFHKDLYKDYIKNLKPKKYRKAKKLISDWSDKKNCLFHYRMLNFMLDMV